MTNTKVNLYSYASNSPINRIDPFGLQDLFFMIEGDLVGIFGGEGSVGIVFDLDNFSESGFFVSGGFGGGANVGIAAGGGFALRDIEGQSVNLDVNFKMVSATVSTDGLGFNGVAASLGPGIGASTSATVTKTFTFNDAFEALKKTYKSLQEMFTVSSKKPCK